MFAANNTTASTTRITRSAINIKVGCGHEQMQVPNSPILTRLQVGAAAIRPSGVLVDVVEQGAHLDFVPRHITPDATKIIRSAPKPIRPTAPPRRQVRVRPRKVSGGLDRLQMMVVVQALAANKCTVATHRMPKLDAVRRELQALSGPAR